VEVQNMDFEVLHAAGDGELMAIPDAMSRDFVDGQALCHRCLEVVAEIDEDAAEKMGHEDAAETMRHEQKAEFGPLRTFARKNGYFLSDEGLVSRLHQSQVQVVVPKTIVQKVFGSVHGARTAGHWGVSRTTLAVARRYWWPEWLADVEELVGKCLPCATTWLGRSGHKNARLVRYTPSRRFELVALDVTEISPIGRRGEKKVVVVGDVKSRFVIAVPTVNETAATIAEILWLRWFTIFGPPEHLLTDLGKPLVSEVMRNLYARAGVSKIFTSPYLPQCKGMIERFNRTLSTDLSRTILCEDSWPEYVSTCVFRYNNSVHSATGETPYRAMFGVDCFEFDAGINLRLRLDDEPDDLAARLAEVHRAARAMLSEMHLAPQE
jgi:Integrase zinc binding domain/Integrase core domain